MSTFFNLAQNTRTMNRYNVSLQLTVRSSFTNHCFARLILCGSKTLGEQQKNIEVFLKLYSPFRIKSILATSPRNVQRRLTLRSSMLFSVFFFLLSRKTIKRDFLVTLKGCIKNRISGRLQNITVEGETLSRQVSGSCPTHIC